MTFYIPVDLSRITLLLTDIQGQIAGRLPQDEVDALTDNVLNLLTLFRTEIARRRGDPATIKAAAPHSGVPLIIHHVFPAGINGNSFISPYNKLYKQFQSLEAAGHLDRMNTDPNQPNYHILKKLVPESGWASKDEVILPKLTASCFGSSELVQYLRARDVKYVILCGLTTVGAVLGTARAGADLDLHMVVVREGVMDDDKEVNDFILDKVLPKFVDVVTVNDIKQVFEI